MSDPYGCRWCGTAERNHGSRFEERVGQHVWQQPTEVQVLSRMLDRRGARD